MMSQIAESRALDVKKRKGLSFEDVFGASSLFPRNGVKRAPFSP